MWRGTEGSNAHASARVGAIVVAVLALAIFSSTTALLITSDDAGSSAFARLITGAERLVGAAAAAEAPAHISSTSASSQALSVETALRSRPAAEREAHARVVPAVQQGVHELGFAFSMAESDPLPLTVGTRILAEVTFYYCEYTAGTPGGDGGDFCEWMRDGTIVYPGAAACHYNYLGQRFTVEGDPLERVYTCNDTGNMILGQHRDIWFMTSAEGWAWQQVVGQYVVIQIVEEAH